MVPVFTIYTCFMYDNRKYNVNSFIGIVVLITVCDI